MSDFEIYWDRCIRSLGVAAQDPQAVAEWCFKEGKENNGVPISCIGDVPHKWSEAMTGRRVICERCGRSLIL